MSLIDNILRCRTLSITGMAKNTGKTLALNYLLGQLRLHGKTVAVTSIGIDGEKTDQVTQTEKPEIELCEGTFFVTSEYHYRQRLLLSEIIDLSDDSTSLGRLVTARVLQAAGIPCERMNMVSEPHPNVVDAIEQGQISFMINTPGGHRARGDGFRIRTMAVSHGIDLVTAMSGATALIQAIAALRTGSLEPYALQDLPSANKRKD